MDRFSRSLILGFAFVALASAQGSLLLLGSGGAPASGSATITHVADNGCDGVSSATSKAIVASPNPTAGNILLVGVRVGAAGRTVTAQDGGGNNGTLDYTFDATSPGAGEISVFRFHNTPGGSTTITVSISGAASSIRGCIMEISGLLSSPKDKTAGATGTSTSPSSGATATRSQAAELLFGVQTNDNSGTANLTAGTNFTLGSILACSANVNCVGVEWQIVSSAGTDAATFTLNNSRGWGAAIVTYKN